MSFPMVCNNLTVLNLSSDNFTGEITSRIGQCPDLEYVDFNTNLLTGNLLFGINWFKEISLSENHLNRHPRGLYFSRKLQFTSAGRWTSQKTHSPEESRRRFQIVKI
ncbi:hypothetical protein L1987_28197 [Smallanthus sonchifolius]|uniref:Uncharacterized protein n=1 Tax=Smallanthus sonchifolius TaxID=185202 RepID=A0ACB9ICT5_9ASTR|nr:hypothetical protein L1987_28197 [Smallanthus sonchifolius]